jgi:UDPglucose 6-dehydrogenase
MIGYAGLSHLGLLSSVAAASKGFDVIGFDEDASLVERLNASDVGIVEPGLPELLAAQRDRLTFTADVSALERCELVYVSVDVPTDDQDRSDVRPVEHLLRLVKAATKSSTIIVVLSQVPPGFCRAQHQFVDALYYQVETLIFGRAIERAVRPERFIVGCADAQQPLPSVLERYLRAFGCPILRMGYESAELCKISINLFLVSSVSTTNMLAEICEVVGAEWREIAPALRLDARIGPNAYLTPGLGIAGGNLRRDLLTIQAVAARHGTDAGLIDVWLSDSRYRRDWALREIQARVLSQQSNPVIALWGLAYKENTNSTKRSPALSLLEALPQLCVQAFDPGVPDNIALGPAVRRVASPLEACAGADALVIMTAWPEFHDIDLSDVVAALRHRVLIDPWGIADYASANRLGFEYVRLGTRARS